MPATPRAHVSRGTSSSSRPYDRHLPTASPAQSENHLSRSLLPASSIQDPNPDPEREKDNPPDHPGLPTYADYKRIEAEYLHSLSPRKRDKALITQAMFDKIWDVLHQPEACTIETPQFRFWVRKMFSLSRPMCVGGVVRVDGTGMATDSDAEETDLELERALGIEANTSAEFFSAVVLHENRPVAIMEQLYELFCYCHVRAGHGGRDKTCAVIRQHYSWVPKELTAQFVKACPTCVLKRSGQGHGGGAGVGGVDMGPLVQRRVVGQRERRVHGTPLGAEEVPLPVVPSSLGNMGWPTTGGPLDPGNPEPCGVRERERERARLGAREDAKSIDPSSIPVSPAPASVDASASDSSTRSVPSQVPLESYLPRGWNGVPWHSTADTSPFHLCDTTNRSVVETTGFPQPFMVHKNNTTRTWSDRVEKRVSTRTGLPSLASALSNESLDENVNLTGLGPQTADECLPPVLRPLRLSGPIPSDTESDFPPPPPPSESYLFQIDPVLLSFNYPGLDYTSPSESGPNASPGGAGDFVIPLALSSEARLASLEGQRGRCDGGICHVTKGGVVGTSTGTGVCRLPRRAPSNCVDTERLNTPRRVLDVSCDERDSEHFEHGAASYHADTLARTTGSTRRCGPGSRYGRRDGPLAMLYPSCSADDSDSVGQALDEPLSFSIMTDASA